MIVVTITIFFLYLIFSIISGISEAIQDVVNNQYVQSYFYHNDFNERFWNHGVSHVNKHKKGEGKSKIVKWFYRNPGVVFTDAWHLFKGISSLSLSLMTITSLILSIMAYLFSMVNIWYILLFYFLFYNVGYLIKKHFFEISLKKLIIK